MPELPEVETIARDLRRQLSGHTFAHIQVLWPRTIDRPDPATFCARLTGATVTGVERRGKFILMPLDTGQTLLTHLRMTGQYLWGADAPHLRVRFALADGRTLLFTDQRKFGRLYLTDTPMDVLGGLGPEPLSPDLTPRRLAGMLAVRRRRLKPLLLDQRFLAGLGNIYTDEALWRAGLHPLRPANTLAPADAARLHAAIVALLTEAIAGGGTSLPDEQYQRPDGQQGDYQPLLNVYGRAGEPCPRCGTPIERITVEQRGTHFCPLCQPTPTPPAG